MRYETITRAGRGAMVATGLAACAAFGACGGEGEGEVDVDAGDLKDSTYDSPDDFDRSACEGGLEDVSLTGIWHVQLIPEGGGDFGSRRPAWIRPQGDALRLDGEGEELTARVAGQRWETARDFDSDLFLRHHFRNEPEIPAVRALNACGTDEEGALIGEYADCHFPFGTTAACDVGSLRAIRVEPRGEAPAAGLVKLAVSAGPDAEVREPGEAAATSVRVRDDVAYVVEGGGYLRMVDVSEPSEPGDLGRLQPSDVGAPIVDLELVGAGDGDVYAVLALGARAVIADVSDPARAELVATVDASERYGGAEAVAVAGDRLYVAAGTYGGGTEFFVGAYDVSDPREPARLGEDDGGADLASQPPTPARNRVYDLRVEGERAYVSFGMLGFHALDVGDPGAIETVDVLDERPRYSRAGAPLSAGDRDLIVHIDEKVGGRLRILDGDEGSSEYLEPIVSRELRPEVSPGHFAVAGEMVYLAHHQDGLRVVDLSDPDRPEEVAHYNVWPGYPEPGAGYGFADGAMSVDVDRGRDLVFVADSHLGLVVLAHD